jgi:tripartite-type tricarboxylate transporter receptor subunit TctC
MKHDDLRLKRRGFLLFAAGALASATSPRDAAAQGFPNRAVKWIVPYPPGGATDVSARIIAQRMSQRLGQPFIIENKPGAGANLGTEAVVNSAPDGYTLLFVSTANAINASLYKNLRFNFMRDIVPVAAIGRLPIVLEVNPQLAVKTTKELIEYAKQNPGKLTYASAGVGTSLHLTGELFKARAEVDIIHVPYRGSAPALTDLIAGQVHLMFDNISSSIEHIRAGKLRALAVATESRFEGLPDVPTLGETLPSFNASSLYGVGAPRNTPSDVVALLNREVSDALRDPSIKARLTELAIITSPGTSEDFGQALAAETNKWAGIITRTGVSAD